MGDNMELNSLMGYTNLLIVGICLCVGYAIKKAKIFTQVKNDYIPMIMLILGTILSIIANIDMGVNLEIILTGMISGLASTGCYESFRVLLDRDNSNKNQNE